MIREGVELSDIKKRITIQPQEPFEMKWSSFHTDNFLKYGPAFYTDTLTGHFNRQPNEES